MRQSTDDTLQLHTHYFVRNTTTFLDEEIEKKQVEVTKNLGFILTSHKMELFADCIQKNNCNRKKAK